VDAASFLNQRVEFVPQKDRLDSIADNSENQSSAQSTGSTGVTPSLPVLQEPMPDWLGIQEASASQGLSVAVKCAQALSQRWFD
jgi:hypothetical protein